MHDPYIHTIAIKLNRDSQPLGVAAQNSASLLP
jgi:hypothetical protein